MSTKVIPRTSPWTKHVISERFPFGFEAIGVDLDGDGDMEVVATGGGEEGRVAVFKHRGDPRGVWDMETHQGEVASRQSGDCGRSDGRRQAGHHCCGGA